MTAWLAWLAYMARASARAAVAIGFGLTAGPDWAASQTDEAHRADPIARLIASYPAFLDRRDGNMLVWKDGTRMAIDDGAGAKSFATLLAKPDIKDMFYAPYRAGPLVALPQPDIDPGRVRNDGFFARMYGDCRKGEVEHSLVDVVWLPTKWAGRLKVTRINGVAEKLDAVSRELDRLPAAFDAYLLPPAGTFNCRPITGTDRPSAHGLGIAIDIATAHAHYWRWSKPQADGRYAHRNSVPPEIVAVFEKHGFIWGGKWYHYDTMHFEYRPELLPP